MFAQFGYHKIQQLPGVYKLQGFYEMQSYKVKIESC